MQSLGRQAAMQTKQSAPRAARVAAVGTDMVNSADGAAGADGQAEAASMVQIHCGGGRYGRRLCDGGGGEGGDNGVKVAVVTVLLKRWRRRRQPASNRRRCRLALTKEPGEPGGRGSRNKQMSRSRPQCSPTFPDPDLVVFRYLDFSKVMKTRSTSAYLIISTPLPSGISPGSQPEPSGISPGSQPEPGAGRLYWEDTGGGVEISR